MLICRNGEEVHRQRKVGNPCHRPRLPNPRAACGPRGCFMWPAM